MTNSDILFRRRYIFGFGDVHLAIFLKGLNNTQRGK